MVKYFLSKKTCHQNKPMKQNFCMVTGAGEPPNNNYTYIINKSNKKTSQRREEMRRDYQHFLLGHISSYVNFFVFVCAAIALMIFYDDASPLYDICINVPIDHMEKKRIINFKQCAVGAMVFTHLCM